MRKLGLFFGVLAICVTIGAVTVVFLLGQEAESSNEQIPTITLNAEPWLVNEMTQEYLAEEYDEETSYKYEEDTLYEHDETEQLPEAYYDYEQEDEPQIKYPEYEDNEYSNALEQIVEENVERPMVALTFDDGPAESTAKILDILDYHDARATFFVIGRRLNQWRGTALRAFESGHEVANHTHFHQSLVYPLTDDEIIHEIQAASAAIEAVTGEPPPRMFRPPAGRVEDRTARIAAELGYALILWNVDPFDWRDRNAQMIYQHIMLNVTDGSIIVLHDTQFTTAQAMELVVPRLIEKGFDLVTVSELFYRSLGRVPSPGRVYRHAN